MRKQLSAVRSAYNMLKSGKTIFEKLCKSRDKKSKARQKLKQEWKEKR